MTNFRTHILLVLCLLYWSNFAEAKAETVWKDGDTIWYKATYNDPLADKTNIADEVAICPASADKNFQDPKLYDGHCEYRTSINHAWLKAMVADLNRENTNQKMLPPNKKLPQAKLLALYDSIKAKYANNCPIKNSEIIFSHPNLYTTERDMRNAFGMADDYVIKLVGKEYTDYICRTKSKMSCPAGFIEHNNAIGKKLDTLPLRPGCVKFKTPTLPKFTSERIDVYLSCPDGGCIDYSKAEKFDPHMPLRFAEGSYGNNRAISNPNYLQHYCKLNAKSPIQPSQCQSHSQYKEARANAKQAAAIEATNKKEAEAKQLADAAKQKEDEAKQKELQRLIEIRTTGYKSRLDSILSGAKGMACTPWVNIPNMFAACASSDSTAKEFGCSMVAKATTMYDQNFQRLEADFNLESAEIKAAISPLIKKTAINQSICK